MYAKYPMEYVNVTQVPNNNYSHKGSMSAWDGAGRDTGIDNVFAPFDCKVTWKDNPRSNTGIQISNTVEVLCADGVVRKPNTIHVILWHDNDTNNLWVGKTIKQGEAFYQEGTAGRATGNHVHFNVGIGTYNGSYPLRENEFSVWEIKGEIDPTKIFFIDDTHKLIKTNGMNWVKYVDKPDGIKVGDKVKIIGIYYATGQKVPYSVKLKTHTIQSINKDKALLKEIVSWVYLKDLKEV